MRADRPSSTALLIAAATVFLARDPRLAQLVPLDRAGARAALAEGTGQVVMVGAGFDTLAARLAPKFPRVKFIEVDHPATQEYKRFAVKQQNLLFVEADLARTGLEEALQGQIDSNAKSFFVIEGLLMYLTEAEIAALFEALGRLQRAGGRVVFTQMESAPDGRSRFHNATPLVTGLLALWREPFKSAQPREAAAGFLSEFGYRLKAVADHEQLQKQFLDPDGKHMTLARGELVYLAQR